jgi:16S rRNA (cytosine967-C5)-methyltransferase
MAKHSPKSARKVAVEVLSRFDPERNYAAAILNRLLVKTAEKQRATDLVFGSIRNRIALDTVIAKLSGRPVERIATRLLNILRIAAFELIYSPETPQYSIVNEAVENTKAVGGKKQAGFVNAVLRQITRHIAHRQTNLAEANPRNTIPQTATTGCEFSRCTSGPLPSGEGAGAELLPDPKASPDEYLSIAFSLPKWLVTDWLCEFGAEPTRHICFASNRRPSIYLRPNTLKTTAQKLAEKLRQASIDLEIVSSVIPAKPALSKLVPSAACPEQGRRVEGVEGAGIQKSDDTDDLMIKIKSPQAVTELPGFAEGLFTVQDITASRAVRILRPSRCPSGNWTMLDLCSAPGVKTTQLAELTGDKAKIIATDIDNKRLQQLKANTARLGINSVNIAAPMYIGEGLESNLAEFGPFDAILLDVPCSNTGVLAKRVEVRYRIKPNAIRELTKTQSELLATAARMIKPRGKICYSTCTIQKAENGQLVRDFLLQNPSLELEFEELILPSAEKPDHDGGYVAIIVKKSRYTSGRRRRSRP